MAYVAFFAISLGPIFWLLIAEIYPLQIRGLAEGTAAGSNWIFNLVVSITFLTPGAGDWSQLDILALWGARRLPPFCSPTIWFRKPKDALWKRLSRAGAHGAARLHDIGRLVFRSP